MISTHVRGGTGLYADGDIDAICRNIEEASADVDAMLERMRNEPDIQKRREIAKQDGGAIGRLDVAMKLATVLSLNILARWLEPLTI